MYIHIYIILYCLFAMSRVTFNEIPFLDTTIGRDRGPSLSPIDIEHCIYHIVQYMASPPTHNRRDPSSTLIYIICFALHLTSVDLASCENN